MKREKEGRKRERECDTGLSRFVNPQLLKKYPKPKIRITYPMNPTRVPSYPTTNYPWSKDVKHNGDNTGPTIAL